MPARVSEAIPPLERLTTLPENEPAITLGWGVARWTQDNLIQPNGPRAGSRFELTRDQLRFILWFYALDETGSWIFNHGVRRLAKGSGKSPFAAVMALAELLGPVRLDRFASPAEVDADGLEILGGVIGKSVEMPWVQIVATSKDQTKNTMRMVRAFSLKKGHSDGPLSDRYALDVGKTQIYMLPEGTLEVITSSVASAEGAESSFIVADETEHWRPGNSGPELMETIQDNVAKSGNRLLETSNSWEPGVGSVSEDSWNAWVAQQEGRAVGSMGILYDARMAPPDADFDDPESIAAALRFVYADCDWKIDPKTGIVDISYQLERVYALTASESAARRKYLNRPTEAEDAWLTVEEWSRLFDPNRIVDDAEEVVLFFDGSKSRDATALIGCCVSDGHIFAIGVWEPDSSHDTEDVVPVAEVNACVDRAFSRWTVVGFFGDVQEWESFVKVSWPDEHADGLEVHAESGGKDPQPIAWDMRTKVFDFTAAAELTLAEIRECGFTHDGDPRVARHMANARRRTNRYGISIGKESPSSRLKIDAAVSVIGARLVRRRLLSARAKKPKKKQAGRVIAWS
jgi:hypothetical protein